MERKCDKVFTFRSHRCLRVTGKSQKFPKIFIIEIIIYEISISTSTEDKINIVANELKKKEKFKKVQENSFTQR